MRQQISEMIATGRYIKQLFERSTAQWPKIKHTVEKIFPEKEFSVRDDTWPIYDLSLAVTGLELQVIRNLFPAEQAARIERWIDVCFELPPDEYARSEVAEYDRMFREELERILAGGQIEDWELASPEARYLNNARCAQYYFDLRMVWTPVDAVSVRLLHTWLGDAICNFEEDCPGRKCLVINPLMVSLTTENLTSLLGGWKRLRDEFDIVPEDLPYELMRHANLEGHIEALNKQQRT